MRETATTCCLLHMPGPGIEPETFWCMEPLGQGSGNLIHLHFLKLFSTSTYSSQKFPLTVLHCIGCHQDRDREIRVRVNEVCWWRILESAVCHQNISLFKTFFFHFSIALLLTNTDIPQDLFENSRECSILDSCFGPVTLAPLPLRLWTVWTLLLTLWNTDWLNFSFGHHTLNTSL